MANSRSSMDHCIQYLSKMKHGGKLEWILWSLYLRLLNQLTTCLFEKTNTEHRITSAYHPQVLYCMKQYSIVLSAVLTLIIPQYTNIFFNRQTD